MFGLKSTNSATNSYHSYTCRGYESQSVLSCRPGGYTPIQISEGGNPIMLGDLSRSPNVKSVIWWKNSVLPAVILWVTRPKVCFGSVGVSSAS